FARVIVVGFVPFIWIFTTNIGQIRPCSFRPKNVRRLKHIVPGKDHLASLSVLITHKLGMTVETAFSSINITPSQFLGIIFVGSRRRSRAKRCSRQDSRHKNNDQKDENHKSTGNEIVYPHERRSSSSFF